MADEDKDNPIIRIANQAVDIFKQRGRRWDTYFYKVVLAGNVKAIKQVVAHLESKGSTETLDWLFKRNKFEEMDHVKRKKSTRLLGIRGIIFIVLNLVNLIVTPFFYALHMLSTSLLNRKQRRISASIRLPLAYAAFSQKHEMVAFFLSQGIDIDHIDQRGNNIFHYISDLSAVSPDTAIQIFQTAVKEIDDRDSVKKLLEHDRNSAGFTAVEYAAKFGSPSLLTQILREPNLLHHTPFLASKDQVKFMKEDDKVETNIGARTKVEVVDVSMYEGGRLTDQSTLLNILSDRDIARMSSVDLEIFDDVQLIGRWLILKCKQMLYGVMVLHIIDVILTCLMMYVLAMSFIGRNGVDFRTWKLEADSKVQLDEITAWTKNESSMFKKHAFDELVHKLRVDKQRLWFDQLLTKDPNTTRLLLNASSLDPMVEQALLDGEHNISTDRLSESMDILYEHVMKMPELSNATTNLMIARLVPRIIEEFAKELLARKDEFLHGVNSIFDVRNEFYTNFSIEVDKKVISPFQFLEPWDISGLLCPATSNLDKEDLKLTIFSVTFEDIKDNSGDFCLFYVIANTIQNRTCKATDHETVLQIYHYSDEGRDMLYHIKQFVITCAYLYILLDMVERCMFLTKSVVYQTSPQDMIITALGQKVPGSYVRKQLNVLSCLAIIIQYHFNEFILSYYFNNVNKYEANKILASQSYIAMVFIVAIVVRFLMHIHSLRLLPGIGHFVITTFMMGTNLLHFSAVFGIVLLIFSTLFHILIDDPNCPLEKSEGFLSMQDSLFSTFKLTFAHGDMEPFFTSAPVQLTYVLYVIIVGLLLLNLIIAIMSTTATEIMAEPWKEVLWKVEWLDEATSAEYAMSVLTLPFRKFTGRGHFSHKKAGYIVKKLPDNKYKIYIECFQCAALQD